MQVRALAGGAHHERVAEAEERDDVVLNRGRGRGGQGQDRRTAEAFGDLAQAQVGRAKLVTPFGDAVGLVDHEEAAADGGELVGKAGALHPLGRDVREIERAAAEGAERFSPSTS